MKKLLSPNPWYFSAGILLTRILTGIFLVYHGWEIFDNDKLLVYTKWFTDMNFPSPYFLSFLGKLSELIAGLMFVTGFGVRIASIITALTMLFITFVLGEGKIFTDAQHPFLFVVISMLLFVTGAGKWSVDALIYPSKKNSLTNNTIT